MGMVPQDMHQGQRSVMQCGFSQGHIQCGFGLR
jgi:hypothetical protein